MKKNFRPLPVTLSLAFSLVLAGCATATSQTREPAAEQSSLASPNPKDGGDIGNRPDQEACRSNEIQLFRCSNQKAGWGLDNLIVEGCKDKKSGAYSLIIRRIDPTRYMNRMPAERIDSDSLELFSLEALVYTESHHFTYSIKKDKAQYRREETSGNLSATLNCKLLVKAF